MYTYSNPKRESDPHSLPDVEVWESFHAVTICKQCGTNVLPYETVYAGPKAYCPTCDQECDRRYNDNLTHWYYWNCFNGCLPDSDPFGPFESEESAIEAAQEDSWQVEDESDEDVD